MIQDGKEPRRLLAQQELWRQVRGRHYRGVPGVGIHWVCDSAILARRLRIDFRRRLAHE